MRKIGSQGTYLYPISGGAQFVLIQLVIQSVKHTHTNEHKHEKNTLKFVQKYTQIQFCTHKHKHKIRI